MRINRLISCGILSICLLLPLSAQESKTLQGKPSAFVYNAKPEDVGVSSDRLKKIDMFMTNYVRDGYAPNIVTFVARHGKVVHNKAYGWKNIENKVPVKVDDIF